MKAEDLTITSVTAAIDAMQRNDFMHDIQPVRSAKGGDENFGLWFRGHEKTSHTLTPSMLRRPNNNPGAYLDEVSLYRHFQTMNPDASPRDTADFERMVLMQHYQTPTRLLDWSENLLVALYFAVRDPNHDDEDSAIWVLNARRLNYHASATTRNSLVAFPSDPDVVARSCLCRVRDRVEWRDVFARELRQMRFDREEYRHERISKVIGAVKEIGLSHDSLNDADKTPFDLRRFEIRRRGREEIIDLYAKDGWQSGAKLYTRLRMPVAVHAPRSNRRISSQSGVFTLHGGKLEPKPKDHAHESAIGLPISIEEIETGLKKSRVAKWMVIPKSARAGMRQTLVQIGISDASLFPELEYQSKHLVARWTYHDLDLENGE